MVMIYMMTMEGLYYTQVVQKDFLTHRSSPTSIWPGSPVLRFIFEGFGARLGRREREFVEKEMASPEIFRCKGQIFQVRAYVVDR